MSIPQEQAEAASFLQTLTNSQPFETHISAVFVGEHDVYKLKKSVRLAFLDFTRLQSRAAMARREIELNRPAAPEIYRSVLAIIRAADGTLQFAADGAPGAIEYVVHMAPIPPGDFLDRIVAEYRLTAPLLDAIGDCIADLHAALPPIPHHDAMASLRRIIGGNAQAARAAGLSNTTVAQWQSQILEELRRVGPTLAARAGRGCVRRLHGDLHVGNICLWRGKPTAFDALEFDDALATEDVAYDLAFLLMDLSFHAGRASANRVMNRYIARTGDVGLLATMPLFLSIRAIVRAHVQATRGQPEEAALYVRTAMDSLRPVPPILVAIGGLQGTGKSTLARALAPDLGRPPGACVLRSDEIRKRLFGALPEQKLPPDAYTQAANSSTNAALIAQAEEALAAGHAAVLDSTFLHEPLRHAAEAAAHAARCQFIGFWLEADLATLIRRVTERTGDASDAGPDIVRRAASADPGAIPWHRLRAADATACLRQAREKLPVQPRSAPPA